VVQLQRRVVKVDGVQGSGKAIKRRLQQRLLLLPLLGAAACLHLRR
jgi:hypothetical protein